MSILWFFVLCLMDVNAAKPFIRTSQNERVKAEDRRALLEKLAHIEKNLHQYKDDDGESSDDDTNELNLTQEIQQDADATTKHQTVVKSDGSINSAQKETSAVLDDDQSQTKTAASFASELESLSERDNFSNLGWQTWHPHNLDSGDIYLGTACKRSLLEEHAMTDANSSENVLLAEHAGKLPKIRFMTWGTTVNIHMNGNNIQSSGKINLRATLNQQITRKWKYKKTVTFPLLHGGVFAAYASLGIDLNLAMNAWMGLQVDIPIEWYTDSGNPGSSWVSIKGAQFHRWFGWGTSGVAKISLAVSAEKIGLIAVKMSGVATMTLNQPKGAHDWCWVSYDAHAKSKALKTGTLIANLGVTAYNLASGLVGGKCLDEFDEPHIHTFYSKPVWGGWCAANNR